MTPELQAGLFRLDAEDDDVTRVVPHELTRGPWDPGAMHGGPPAALLARAVERFEPGHASHVARFTVDLLRPVPLAPLEVRARMVRPGRNVQIVEATLRTGDTDVVRAAALRLREKSLDLGGAPSGDGQAPLPPPGEPEPVGDRTEPNFGHAVDLAHVRGSFDEIGPATVWMRLRLPVVEGEEPSPLMRVAAAADFGNGVSAALDWDAGWTFINPDLTIYLHRPAAGEWVGLDAVTWAESSGLAVADTALHDQSGRIGRSVQSLLVDRGERRRP